ncbi:MAG: hypothetical protein DRN19_03240, partial [Thermoplasmata archaeon]
ALRGGAKEIQLTSQDLASYGVDKGWSLLELVKDIASLEDEFMIRLGMMNPASVKKRLEEIVSLYSFDKVYKFLHLPVQSGDNEILKKMKRGYTVEEFAEMVDIFRSEYPDITLATDIIVAFPGESEESFQKTVNLIKEIEPDVTNITRFSPRPFTEAKRMKERVPTDIAKERSRYLSKLCESISLKINKKYIGKKYRALTIERGKNSTIVARTTNYKPVMLMERIDIGRFVDVEITGYSVTHLVGKLI